MPAVLIEPAPPITTTTSTEALAIRSETIEAAYDAWDEVRAELLSVNAAFDAERRRLDEQGALLIGAVRSAIAPASGPEALLKRNELAALAEQAKANLESARTDLEERATLALAALRAAEKEIVAAVRARVVRQLSLSPPKLELMVRVLPQERRILHLRRLEPDDAVTFLFAVSGRVPSRYEALFDDSTDDPLLAPPCLYPDEGVTDVRPKAEALVRLLDTRAEVWPVKGMVPSIANGSMVRWLSRGAVLEAECAEGESFRNQLTVEEAERLTGALLALKLEGKAEFELVRG